ncbi:tRNA (Guanine37-N(1)-) methyltransferase [Candidatus Thermokryptus mobilis]|uniref:tRNA (guanine-N(1)-)-methyltransferase n=1 Tax=Candidatus Thermokryptus mobilis TaxID=1643428 RepID=A0A0S4NCD4_9BACT|nr:tRNA (guanosine(37)-N1)-methyltransferase TrmD [Candidatus Thermokryptus mobilis]CUU08067.1 tRNA (Guanine37-N(1)-) methyltransferase [Candidatus Thermokryptus mobilis]
MRIDIITAVPQIFESPLNSSIIKRAREKGIVEIYVHDLHDYGIGKYRQIDDHPYGGGAGMILKPEPIFECIEKLKSEREYDEIIFLTPDGELFNQEMANEFSKLNNIILLCGHYKGVDERVREALVTREVSIGDYVLTGGELPALVVIDATIRLIPGVLNDIESAMTDSFQSGLLDHPHYTRPAEYRGMKVPEVLLSGNHEAIRKWRYEKALEKTLKRRKDLLNKIKGDGKNG